MTQRRHAPCPNCLRHLTTGEFTMLVSLSLKDRLETRSVESLWFEGEQWRLRLAACANSGIETKDAMIETLDWPGDTNDTEVIIEKDGETCCRSLAS